MTAFLFLIFNHISVLSQNINLHINFSCEQTEKDKLPGQHTCVMSRLTGARQLVCKEHSHRVQYLNLTSYHHFFSSVVTSFLRRAQHLVSEGEDRKRKAQQVWSPQTGTARSTPSEEVRGHQPTWQECLLVETEVTVKKAVSCGWKVRKQTVGGL